MTAQIADRLLFEGTEYSIAALEREWPFDPKAHGFEPVSTSTACWRGYYCHYAVRDNALLLLRLVVGMRGRAPSEWRGIQPKQGEFFKFDGMWTYSDVEMPID